jgi:hypothetical protein
MFLFKEDFVMQWTAWYKSNTMRALLVGAIAFGLDRVGLPEALSQGTAQQLVDLLLGTAQGGAMLWGLYARSRQPTPPLTLTQASADRKNAVADEQEGDDTEG